LASLNGITWFDFDRSWFEMANKQELIWCYFQDYMIACRVATGYMKVAEGCVLVHVNAASEVE